MITTNILNALNDLNIQGHLGTHIDDKGLTLANLYSAPRVNGFFMKEEWFNEKMECTEFDDFLWIFFSRMLPLVTGMVTAYPEHYASEVKKFQVSVPAAGDFTFIGIDMNTLLICEQSNILYRGKSKNDNVVELSIPKKEKMHDTLELTFRAVSTRSMVERFKKLTGNEQRIFIQAIIEFGKNIYLDSLTQYCKRGDVYKPFSHDALLSLFEGAVNTEVMDVGRGVNTKDFFNTYPAWIVVDEMLILPASIITVNASGMDNNEMFFIVDSMARCFGDSSIDCRENTGRKFNDAPDHIYSLRYPLTQSLETAKQLVATLTGYGVRY